VTGDRISRREVTWLAMILAAFLGMGSLFVAHLLPGDAEWGYLVLGRMAVAGEISLFQDEMMGERLPMPFYAIGISQLVTGPSLAAARAWSLLLGAGALVATFALGRAVGGPGCGILSAAFLATHSMVIGFYAAASYFAWAALLIVGGMALVAGVRRPWGSLLGMACFSALALSRAHLAVMAPVVLIYLLMTAPDRRERWGLLAVAAVPPLVFLAWSPQHLKILAYVPVLDRLVAPLGYVSLFKLGGLALVPIEDRSFTEGLVWFMKRHAAWLLATGALALGWVVARSSRVGERLGTVPPLIWILTGVSLYTLAWQALIVHMAPRNIGAWAVTWAPLWAVVMGYGAAVLLEPGRPPAAVRWGVVALLVVVFLVGPSRSRHPSMPLRLPVTSVVGTVNAEATALRRILRTDRPVFLVGNPIPLYLAGHFPYLQQVIHWWTLVPSSDDRAVSRSGLWGSRQIDQWLGHEASYAIISPALMSGYEELGAYRPLAARMRRLLAEHFTRVAVLDGGGQMAVEVYRRKEAER
jgi:hypothetical protein